ncbi:MAG: hypothetical protein IPP74_05340 [Alphaproteobacteria bacterium]|nr:hypothetical protein [Alphaproteobacteria bacterium]
MTLVIPDTLKQTADLLVEQFQELITTVMLLRQNPIGNEIDDQATILEEKMKQFKNNINKGDMTAARDIMKETVELCYSFRDAIKTEIDRINQSQKRRVLTAFIFQANWLSRTNEVTDP